MAIDPDGEALIFSLTDEEPDDTLLEISAVGQLGFVSPPDFETPIDANSDGTYEVEVQIDDGRDGIATDTVLITVQDVVEGLVI